jgi:hypothetical protein
MSALVWMCGRSGNLETEEWGPSSIGVSKPISLFLCSMRMSNDGSSMKILTYLSARSAYRVDHPPQASVDNKSASNQHESRCDLHREREQVMKTLVFVLLGAGALLGLISTAHSSNAQDATVEIESLALSDPRTSVPEDGPGRAVSGERLDNATNYEGLTVTAMRPVRRNGEVLGKITFSSPYRSYPGFRIDFFACKNIRLQPDDCFNGSTIDSRNWPGSGSYRATAQEQNSCRNESGSIFKYYSRAEIRDGGRVVRSAESPPSKDQETSLNCS